MFSFAFFPFLYVNKLLDISLKLFLFFEYSNCKFLVSAIKESFSFWIFFNSFIASLCFFSTDFADIICFSNLGIFSFFFLAVFNCIDNVAISSASSRRSFSKFDFFDISLEAALLDNSLITLFFDWMSFSNAVIWLKRLLNWSLNSNILLKLERSVSSELRILPIKSVFCSFKSWFCVFKISTLPCSFFICFSKLCRSLFTRFNLVVCFNDSSTFNFSNFAFSTANFFFAFFLSVSNLRMIVLFSFSNLICCPFFSFSNFSNCCSSENTVFCISLLALRNCCTFNNWCCSNPCVGVIIADKLTFVDDILLLLLTISEKLNLLSSSIFLLSSSFKWADKPDILFKLKFKLISFPPLLPSKSASSLPVARICDSDASNSFINLDGSTSFTALLLLSSLFKKSSLKDEIIFCCLLKFSFCLAILRDILVSRLLLISKAVVVYVYVYILLWFDDNYDDFYLIG